MFGDTISIGVIKFYSLPFPAGGLTLNLTVSSGYISCYVSDRFRNPNQYMFDRFIIVGDYYEVYLDPQTLSGTQGRYVYVSFLGGNSVNGYQAESFLGNALTVGEYAISCTNPLPSKRTLFTADVFCTFCRISTSVQSTI